MLGHALAKAHPACDRLLSATPRDPAYPCGVAAWPPEAVTSRCFPLPRSSEIAEKI